MEKAELMRVIKSCSCLYVLFLLFCSLFVFAGFQEETQEYQLRIQDEEGNEINLYRDSYALVIGIDDYTGGWPSLPGVKEDIIAVERILTQHGFNVTVTRNPNRDEFVKAVERFIFSMRS